MESAMTQPSHTVLFAGTAALAAVLAAALAVPVLLLEFAAGAVPLGLATGTVGCSW